MKDNIFNELVVVKRSGQRVPFNGNKIAIAIKKAFDSVYLNSDEDSVNKTYNNVLKYIENNYIDRKTINVEDIQDVIENILKEEKYSEVYNSFNNYREKRKAFREVLDKKQQHKFTKATEKLVLAIENENSSPSELMLNFGKTISEEFSKSYLIDSRYVRSHDEGSIYIHDLKYYVFGTTSSTHLDFSNINDYDNFFEKILNILLNIKKEQHKEHSFPAFDYILEPWIIYEFKNIFKKNLSSFIELDGFNKYINLNPINSIINKLNTIYVSIDIFKKYIYSSKVRQIFENAYNSSFIELKKSLESKINKFLNCLNTCEFQLNNEYGYSISLGTNDSKEGIFICETYFKTIEKLPRLNSVATIYKIKNIKNNSMLSMISKLLLLNKNIAFSNINASFNKKYKTINNYKTEVEYFSDGKRILEDVSSKNQTSTGRMIVAETSINLARIALKNKNIKDFYKELSSTMDFVKNELKETFEYISNKSKKDFKYLFSNNILLENDKVDDNQKIKKIIKNGTLNIGYSGLIECIHIMNNKLPNETTIEDLKLGLDIIKYMKDKCDEFLTENKLNFTLSQSYETEVLKYFKSIDLSIYGSIKNINNEETYMPLYRVFNNLDIPINERLKLESKIEKHSNGGYYKVISISKNYSSKKIIEIINLMIERDIGFFKFTIGKSE